MYERPNQILAIFITSQNLSEFPLRLFFAKQGDQIGRFIAVWGDVLNLGKFIINCFTRKVLYVLDLTKAGFGCILGDFERPLGNLLTIRLTFFTRKIL
jgi:hypothetical protein